MTRAGEQAGLSSKTQEQVRLFLSALFMAVRTTQLHHSGNQAFERAVENLRESIDNLHATTNGFSVQLAEDSVFLNGSHVRIGAAALHTVRTLRSILEQARLGGLDFRTRPSRENLERLLRALTQQGPNVDLSGELQRIGIGGLAVQRIQEHDQREINIDRRLYSAHLYAKLLLVIRDRHKHLDSSTDGPPVPIRAVRVIQDLIELGQDRPDFLVQLGLTTSGVTPRELHAANSCLLAIVAGQTLGLDRKELVDIGMAALHHTLAPDSSAARQNSDAAFARLLVENRSTQTMRRAVFVVEHALDLEETFAWGKPRHAPHPLSRLLGTISRFCRLTLGLDSGYPGPLEPPIAMAVLCKDSPRKIDPRIADVLINCTRIFPVGAEVVLEQRLRAIVKSLSSRWDRPRVILEDNSELDLEARDGERYTQRIVSTATFAGLARSDRPLPPSAPESLEIESAAISADWEILDDHSTRELEEDIPTAPPPLSQIIAGDAVTSDLLIQAQELRIIDAGDEPDVQTHRSGDLSVRPSGTGMPTESLIAPPPKPLSKRPAPEGGPPPRSLSGKSATEAPGPLPQTTGSEERTDLTQLTDQEMTLLEQPEESTRRASSAPPPADPEQTPKPHEAPHPPSLQPPELEVEETVEIHGYAVSPRVLSDGPCEIYRGRDPDDQTPITLRRLDAKRVRDARLPALKWIEWFEREGVIASTISHPALPRLIDVGRSGDCRFLVYERTPGRTLLELTRMADLIDPQSTRVVVRGLAEGLHHLHERGFVHGHVRLDGIAVSRGLQPRLMDLSRAFAQDQSPHPLLGQGIVLAPEFLAGEPFGPLADQFSLGAVLYELLTGMSPDVEPGGAEPAHALELAPDAHPLLAAAAMTMLSFDPADRFESCDVAARYLSRSAAIERKRRRERADAES